MKTKQLNMYEIPNKNQGFLHGPESFGNLAEFARVGILHMFV